MKIISFIRSVKDISYLKPAKYHAKECHALVSDGKFITSSDALASKNRDAKFLFLGSAESLESIDKRFSFDLSEICPEKVKISDDYSEIFKAILSGLDDDNEVVIDITHGDRDTTFIAPLAMLLNSTLKAQNLTILHAKVIKSKKDCEYEFVKLDDYLSLMQFSFVLISFKQFIKVPNLSIKSPIYRDLKEFSNDFLANRVYKCKESFPKLKESLIKAKNEDLSFFGRFIDDILEEFDALFSSMDPKKEYKNYYLMAEFLYKKSYFLNASQYLIEAIPKYIYENIKEYITTESEADEKELTSLCNNFMKHGTIKSKHIRINLPFENFYELNSHIFNAISSLRDNIGDIRHELTHIRSSDLGDIQAKLGEYLGKFKEMVLDEDILSNLDRVGVNQGD